MRAELLVADLTNGADVVRALHGCKRMYFGMSISPPYLQATAIVAAAAKEISECLSACLTLLVYYYCSIYRGVFVNVSADDAYTRPDVVANAVLKAVTSKNPTMRYLAGKEANAQL